MEFFVAFFGLTYWLFRCFDNHVQQERYNKKIEESTRRYHVLNKSWEQTVVDRELENELWDYVVYPLNYKRVWEDISPVLQTFPSLSKLKRLCFTTKDAKEYYCITGKMAQKAAEIDRSIALRILLAKQGKLLHSDAYFGFDKRMLARCTYDDLIDFLLWINKQLEMHGIHEKLIIDYMPYYYYLNEDTRRIRGSIYWYPSISYIDLDSVKHKPE